VDGDGDGQRNLWTDWADVFASVGNYLKGPRWRAGEPVMAPATVDGADMTGRAVRQLTLDDTSARCALVASSSKRPCRTTRPRRWLR
jgi:membrane-bound lytic murein transglycosylase B